MMTKKQLEEIKERFLEEKGWSPLELLDELMEAQSSSELEENFRWIDNQHDLGLFDEDEEEYEEEEEEDEEVMMCQECRNLVEVDELRQTYDVYGIPYKLCCGKCYDKIEGYINRNRYGDELTSDEIYGEEY